VVSYKILAKDFLAEEQLPQSCHSLERCSIEQRFEAFQHVLAAFYNVVQSQTEQVLTELAIDDASNSGVLRIL